MNRASIGKSMSANHRLGIRPLCPCCSGGDVRGRHGKYSMEKAKSHYRSQKARRGKARYKDH
jgi:hypothetical protein